MTNCEQLQSLLKSIFLKKPILFFRFSVKRKTQTAKNKMGSDKAMLENQSQVYCFIFKEINKIKKG